MHNPDNNKRPGAALLALTCAAAALPGMSPTDARAQSAEDSLLVQTAKYRESDRDLINVTSDLEPVTVDVLSALGRLNFDNRTSLNFNLSQDVWSGATPVATAPLAFNGNRPILKNTPDGVIESGASPFVNGSMALNRQLQPVMPGGAVDERDVVILSSASPEVRRQANASLAYEWDEAMLAWSLGTSRENDYISYSTGINGRKDFNQKLSALSGGISYSRSRIDSVIDVDLQPYLTKLAYADQIRRVDSYEILEGARYDLSASLGWSQIINRSALFELNSVYTQSRGLLENPYKTTLAAFYDPDILTSSSDGLVSADVRALMEQRPNDRNQVALGGKFIQHIASLDASIHMNYQVSQDNWGVRSHAFEVSWAQPLPNDWMLTPTVRYYSQSKADFYTDYLVSGQTYREIDRDDQGREIWQSTVNPDTQYTRNTDGSFTDSQGNIVDLNNVSLRPKYSFFDYGLLPEHFSSDHRLAGFGSLSLGLNVSKQIGRSMTFEAGIEHYRRDSSLQLGGNGGSGFADFESYMATASLTINPRQSAQQQRLEQLANRSSNNHQHHDNSHSSHHHVIPAGVMYGHVLGRQGETMLGYNFEQQRTGRTLYNGSEIAQDENVVAQGCEITEPCRKAPIDMTMNMHMLHFGYGLTDQITLMGMVHLMDMNMNLRDLEGRPPAVVGDHEHDSLRGHTVGGLGDSSIAALYRLGESGFHAGLAISIPTGKVDHIMRRMFREDGGLMHFTMQTGSGTWDLIPSLTYSDSAGAYSWGGQLTGTYRMESENETGYRLGHIWQANTWGAYQISDWVSILTHLSYRHQGTVDGDYNEYNARLGPMDYAGNTGGEFLDAGLGLQLNIPSGNFSGHSFSVEWLEPIQQDLNGFQLRREGRLQAGWHYMF